MTSCCTWFRSTGVNSSLKILLHSYAISTLTPVFCVTQSGCGDVTAAATARATLLLEISLMGIPFRTVDNLDTKMQRPVARSPFASSQLAASADSPLPNCPVGTSFLQSETSSYSPIFAEHPQWPFRAAQSLATPQPGQRALREPSVATSPGPCCAVTVAACCWLRCHKALTETRH